MEFWGAQRGRRWSGGMGMSISELIDFAQDMAALEEN